MKFLTRILFVFIIGSIFFTSPTKASSSYITSWIQAMKNNGANLNNIITHDFEYRQLNFEFGKRLIKGQKGNLPFFAKASRPTTIDVVETHSGANGQIVILNNISETGFYREWQTILLIRSDGIARVSEIALEGHMRGYPPGCPETMYKRNFILTLNGTPKGFNEPKKIKLYKYSRDTDPLEFAHPSLDPKELKKCTPTPDRQTIFSEVVTLDMNNQIEAVNTMAIQNKGVGGIFFKEDGTNFPGRLFDIGGGHEGLLLTFSTVKDSESADIAKLYTWHGSGWKDVWSFDVGHGSKSGLGGRFSRNIEWSLSSSSGSQGPEIVAKLEKNNDHNYGCPAGTTLIYKKSGSGFKLEKSGQPAECFKRNLSGSIKTSPGRDEKPKEILSEDEIDWRFKK